MLIAQLFRKKKCSWKIVRHKTLWCLLFIWLACESIRCFLLLFHAPRNKSRKHRILSQTTYGLASFADAQWRGRLRDEPKERLRRRLPMVVTKTVYDWDAKSCNSLQILLLRNRAIHLFWQSSDRSDHIETRHKRNVLSMLRLGQTHATFQCNILQY